MSSPQTQQLLRDIERFLKVTGMGSCYLGLAAVGNGHLVERLRRGQDIRTNTVKRLKEFMAEREFKGPW